MSKKKKRGREKFSHILLKNCLTALIISIFFMFIMDCVAELSLETVFLYLSDSKYADTAVNTFLSSEYTYDKILSRSNLALSLYGETACSPLSDYFAYITDSEGNMIVESTRRVFLIYNNHPDNDSTLSDAYTCNIDYFKDCSRYEEIKSEYLTALSDGVIKFVFFREGLVQNLISVDEAYINNENHTFLPLKYHVYSPDSTMSPYEEYTFSYTEEELIGYELADKDSIIDTACLGTPSSSKCRSIIMEDCTDPIAMYDDDSDFLINSREFLDLNGNTYHLYECRYMPFISLSLIKLYSGINIIILAIAFAIAFATAKKRDRRNKVFYEMDEYRKTLMDSMSHDLKSPLMAMSGYAENLKENVQTDKREHYAEAVYENAQYMNDIIKNVMELSKLESLKTDLKFEQYDLIELTEELAEKYKPLLDGRGISLSISGSFKCKVDRALISQGLENLLSNAVKYCTDGGSITVSGNSKSMSIQNTTAETYDGSVDNLWTPYIKGDSARSQKLGSGLGLAIVKNILGYNNLKGKIASENHTFIVTLSKAK